MSDHLRRTVAAALSAGTPQAALDAVVGAPMSAGLAIGVAEAMEATFRGRRAAALLTLAARAEPQNRAVVVAAARALLRLGHRGRARRLLADLADSTRVLFAVASGGALPDASDAFDGDDVVDFALASGAPLAELQTILGAAPASCRLRLEVARRQADAADVVGAKATLRAGLQGGRQDARLEVALAMVCFGAGDFDEAAVVVAKARSRHPACAKDRALLVLLAAAQLGAHRREDAISVVHGARAPSAELRALALVLSPEPVAAAGPLVEAAAAASSSPVGPPPTEAQNSDQPKGHEKERIGEGWRGVVVSDASAPGASRGPWAAAAVVVAAVVAVFVIRGGDSDDDDATPAFRDGGVAVVSPDVDAGSGDAPPSAFSVAAKGCGLLNVPGWVEAPMPIAGFAARARDQGWSGRSTKLGALAIDVDPALAPKQAVLVMPTQARADPAAVIDVSAPGVVAGVAVVNVVAAGRAYVRDIYDVVATGLATIESRPCREANPGATCVYGKSQCRELEIRVKAICPMAEATLDALPNCEHGAILVRPAPTVAPAERRVVPDAGGPGVADGGVADAGIVDAGRIGSINTDAGSADVADGGPEEAPADAGQ